MWITSCLKYNNKKWFILYLDIDIDLYIITNIIRFNSYVPKVEDEVFAGPNCPLFRGAADLFTGADLI